MKVVDRVEQLVGAVGPPNCASDVGSRSAGAALEGTADCESGVGNGIVDLLVVDHPVAAIATPIAAVLIIDKNIFEVSESSELGLDVPGSSVVVEGE